MPDYTVIVEGEPVQVEADYFIKRAREISFYVGGEDHDPLVASFTEPDGWWNNDHVKQED